MGILAAIVRAAAHRPGLPRRRQPDAGGARPAGGVAGRSGPTAPRKPPASPPSGTSPAGITRLPTAFTRPGMATSPCRSRRSRTRRGDRRAAALPPTTSKDTWTKQDEISELIAAQAEDRDHSEWMARMEPLKIWHAPVQGYAEIREDPQVQHMNSLSPCRAPARPGAPRHRGQSSPALRWRHRRGAPAPQQLGRTDGRSVGRTWASQPRKSVRWQDRAHHQHRHAVISRANWSTPAMKEDFYVKPGDSVTFAKTVGETDIYLFAGITGDFAVNHVNEQYMARSKYGRRIAHGVLVLGFASTCSSMMIEKCHGTAGDETAVRSATTRFAFSAPSSLATPSPSPTPSSRSIRQAALAQRHQGREPEGRARRRGAAHLGLGQGPGLNRAPAAPQNCPAHRRSERALLALRLAPRRCPAGAWRCTLRVFRATFCGLLPVICAERLT